MRNAFADELTKLARENDKVVLLSGDIGNKLFDNFKKIDERRFYNCGVAEANMMGVAAGMAMSGLRPVIYTITPFTTTRCFEQIRVDACYHKAPVVIVGTGSGLSYAELGPTHHSCEDLAILRVLPNMTVLAPADEVELRQCMRAALRQDGPVYIRIGKKGEKIIPKADDRFEIGHFAHERSRFRVERARPGEIGTHAVPQRAGLADVENRAGGVLEQIDARLQGEGRDFLVEIHRLAYNGGYGSCLASS